jgi:hypothetical protein
MQPQSRLRWILVFNVLMLGLAPGTVLAATQPAGVRVTAWMSTRTPAQNSNVYAFVYVGADKQQRAKVEVTFTWNFRGGAKECTARTDSRGIAWCRQNVGTAPAGSRVTVEAELMLNGTAHTVTTSFTPTAAGTSAPTAAPTPVPTKRAAAAALLPLR